MTKWKTPLLYYVPPDTAEFASLNTGPCAPIALATLFQCRVIDILPTIKDKYGKRVFGPKPNPNFRGTPHAGIMSAIRARGYRARYQWMPHLPPRRGLILTTLPEGLPGYRKGVAQNHIVAKNDDYVFESLIWGWVHMDDWARLLRNKYPAIHEMQIRAAYDVTA